MEPEKIYKALIECWADQHGLRVKEVKDGTEIKEGTPSSVECT